MVVVYNQQTANRKKHTVVWYGNSSKMKKSCRFYCTILSNAISLPFAGLHRPGGVVTRLNRTLTS